MTITFMQHHVTQIDTALSLTRSFWALVRDCGLGVSFVAFTVIKSVNTAWMIVTRRGALPAIAGRLGRGWGNAVH